MDTWKEPAWAVNCDIAGKVALLFGGVEMIAAGITMLTPFLWIAVALLAVSLAFSVAGYAPTWVRKGKQ